MLTRIGRGVARHPRWVVLVWLLAVVAGGGAALGAFGGQGLFDRLSSGNSQVPGEARDGERLLAARSPATRQVLLQLDDLDVTSPRVQADLSRAVASVARVRGVQAVTAPVSAAVPTAGAATGLDAAARALVGPRGRSALVTATVADSGSGTGSVSAAASDAAAARAATALRAAGRAVTAGAPGSRARVGSVSDVEAEINQQVQADLRTGEAAALPLSLVVMVLVFGGFLAAGIPVVGALATIALGLAALLGYSHLTDLDPSVVNIVTILGLGLCIDYGLLVVSRYREELRALAAAGRPGTDPATRALALERTVASAGRTVTFSAVTVAISLAGLLVFGAAVLRSMGLASVSVVVVALLVGLTLVPALLALGGARLAGPGAVQRVRLLRPVTSRLGDVPPEHGFFSALATRVQRRPWAVVVAVAVVLLLLASPALSLRLRADGVELLPAGNASRQFFTDLDARFPAASSPAVTVVADAPLASVRAWSARVADLPGVSSVDPPVQVDGLVTLGVRTRGDASGPAAAAVVDELHAHRPAFRTWVTGGAADIADFQHDLASRAPWAVALVVVATFALLFLLTGSLLVPLKALAVNVLSLGACLGVVVWVFQRGHLEGLLDFSSTGGVETFVPPLALAFGFGLSMDYEVFLLSRVLEAHRAGARTDAAVVVGLQRSGRIITSAALIIVIVFAGFVSGHLLVIKQVGLALAVAVALDATLVRLLLVPAIMTLLGERNWWAPAPLRRLHERIGISEHSPGPGDGGRRTVVE